MSYLVCHVQKFKASDVKGMQKHNQRESQNSKNKDIDKDRTTLNYDLHNQNHINYNLKVKEIIKDGYSVDKGIRKDAVVMTSTLITSDSEYFKKLLPEQQKEFFKKSYEFLKEKYGEKNIISATVHMDEATPHMHLCSVPLTEDGRISAKNIFDRKNLLKLQDELPKHLQVNGFDIKRGEIGSEKIHLDTHDFKKLKVAELEKSVDNKLIEVKELEIKLERTKDTLKNDLKPLQATKMQLHELKYLEVKKSVLGGKMTLIEGDYHKLMELAKQGIIKSNDLVKLQEEKNYITYQSYEYKKAYDESGTKISELKKTIGKYKESTDNLNGQLDALVKTIKKLEPEVREKFMEDYKENFKEISKSKMELQKAKVQSQDFQM